jgi:hypothetical protein
MYTADEGYHFCREVMHDVTLTGVGFLEREDFGNERVVYGSELVPDVVWKQTSSIRGTIQILEPVS